VPLFQNCTSLSREKAKMKVSQRLKRVTSQADFMSFVER